MLALWALNGKLFLVANTNSGFYTSMTLNSLYLHMPIRS